MSLIMPPIGGGSRDDDSRGSGSSAGEHEVSQPSIKNLRIDRSAEKRRMAFDTQGQRSRMESRARVEAALGFHLGGENGGMDMSRAIRPVADQFLELADQEPALVAALEDDVNALFALTDEQMAMRIARGEPMTQMDPVFDSITDVLWEVGANDLAARMLDEDAEAIRGSFKGLVGDEESSAEVARRLMDTDIDPQMTAGIQNVLTGPEAAWVHDGERGLAITTKVDGQPVTAAFQTDGSPVRDGLDVAMQAIRAHERGEIDLTQLPQGDPGIGAAMEAVLSGANRIGRWLDETIPGGAQSLDHMFSVYALGWTPFADAEQEIQAGKAELETDAVKLASVLPLPDEAMIAMIAREIVAGAQEEGMDVTGSEALAAAREAVGEDRDQLLEDFQSMMADEIIEEAQGTLEDQSALGDIVGDAAKGTMRALEQWDAVAQRLGVNTVDFVLDAQGSWQEIQSGDAAEGWELFKTAFEAPVESDVAEYFSLEDDAADTALMFTGMVFDPTNVVFMGPKASGKLFAKAMTDAKFAPLAMRFGPMRSLTKTIAKDASGKSMRTVLSMSGLSDRAYLELFDLAANPNATRKEVEQVLLRELPSTDGPGFYMAEGPNRALRRSTAEGMGRWIENLPGMSPERQQGFFQMFAKLSRHRTMDLSESTFLDDFFDVLVSVHPGQTDDLVRWASDAVEAVRANRGLTDTKAGLLAAQKQSARQRLNNLGAQRSRWGGGDPSTIRSNMGELRRGIRELDRMPGSGAASVDDLVEGGTTTLPTEWIHDRLANPQLIDEFRGNPRAQTTLSSGESGSMVDMAEDVAQVGIQEPLELVIDGAGRIAFRNGNHRLAAALDAGLENVPVAFTRVDDARSLPGNVQMMSELPGSSNEVRRRMTRTLETMGRRLQEVEGRQGPINTQRKEANRELSRAARLEGELQSPDSRAALAEVVYRWLDEQAIRINEAAGRDVVPILENASNRLAPNVRVRDWSEVTGGRRAAAQGDDQVALTMGLAGDDANLVTQLGEIGAFNRAVKLPMPVSPWEVVAAQKLARSPKQWEAFQRSRTRKILGDATSELKALFAFNLLLNPVTATKTHIDETLRYLVDTGDVEGFIKSTLSVIPGTGRFISNPYAAQYGRTMSGFRPDDIKPWVWVDRPGRARQGEYLRQVERWVNGSLLNDDIFRNYAHWAREGLEFVDDASHMSGRRPIAPQGFVDWWETGAGAGRPGRANARSKKLTFRSEDGALSVVDLTADEAFAVMHRGFEHWLATNVDESARGQMRRTLFAAAEGARPGLRPGGADARLLRSVQRVPGHDMSNGLMGGLFELGFGGPSQRRGGVFLEHYMDTYKRNAMTAYQNKGTLITRDSLIAKGMSPEDADWALRQGADNAVVRRMMENEGMVTERQIDAQAFRYARRRADDLLYRLSSTSMAGSKVEAGLMFPFARAQADFLSWWTNHLTRPMQLRMGAGARTALNKHPMLAPLRKGVEAVESIPLNVRAMSKFAHVAAVTNNEHESYFDKAIDGLTFLPNRWSDEILLDIIPGFGPMPAWMVEQAFTRGLIDDETMANIEAIFPALQFQDDSDPLISMMFPDTGRSLRTMMVGATRKMMAMMGEDATNAPGLPGMLVNFLAEEKIPMAAQDFQAGQFAEWLNDNAFSQIPGLPGWNDEANRIATEGAVAANHKEWGGTWRNWAAGWDYDQIEYRILPAYEVMFRDDIFPMMERYGAFNADDLLEVDGQPRIRAVWDRVQAGEGSREDKQYLADTLASIYHGPARETEIIPGYTLQDHLAVTSPGIAVNLVSKTIGLDQPPAGAEEFYEKYINPDTKRIQNVPGGPEGTEIITDARRKGWIVRRPPTGPDGWMRDAHEAALDAADRGVRAVWKAVTGRDWGMDSTLRRDPETREWVPGVKKSLQNVRFEMPEPLADLLAASGLEGMAGESMTVQEFRMILDEHRRPFVTSGLELRGALDGNGLVDALDQHNDGMGRGLVQNVQDFADKMREAGISSTEEWPQEIRDHIREQVGNAITAGYITQADYDAHWRKLFGDLNYEPPVLPPVDELEFGIAVNRDEITDGSVEVTDGDGLSLVTEDGNLRVRLLGINAPEVGTPGYAEATANLERLIAGADEVVLGVHQPEVFGVSQRSGPDDSRMMAFLYVDGVPIYDPTVFTAENPRGAGVGGEVRDLDAILRAGKENG